MGDGDLPSQPPADNLQTGDPGLVELFESRAHRQRLPPRSFTPSRILGQSRWNHAWPPRFDSEMLGLWIDNVKPAPTAFCTLSLACPFALDLPVSLMSPLHPPSCNPHSCWSHLAFSIGTGPGQF